MTNQRDTWTYCNCAGSHRQGCQNDRPGGFPPLTDDDEDNRTGQ